MPKKTLEPQQARSRESLRKLLKAATEVLGQHGVEGATIPRIARHAGLSPGSVYRRFPDKDALIEKVILDLVERQDQGIRSSITLEMARQIPLPVLTEQFVHSLLVSFRARAGMLRAIRQFAHARIGTAFYRKMGRGELRGFEYMVELFLVHRKDIRHPDPRTAVALGLLMVINTLIDLLLYTQGLKFWNELMPKDDQALKRELAQAFLSYLGVEQKPS
jgi:AcrR family transcriptional regulator